MRGVAAAIGLIIGICGSSVRGETAQWPQFRGVEASGVAATRDALPVTFGPNEKVIWKTPLPPGHSSPCIWGDHIFLTAVVGDRLQTLALSRETGRILWARLAPRAEFEDVHQTYGSPATPTPATDGQRVYAYFGSFGLICYDFDGKEVWQRSLPTPITVFGTSASPVVHDGLVILNCDQDVGSFVMALDARTGDTVWRTERPEFPKGFSTPTIWQHDGVEEVIVPGTLRLKAYDLRDGKERWSVRGLSRIVCTTPVIGEELLYVAVWSPGADPGERIEAPSFDEYVAENDKNGDGVITPDEVHEDALQRRFRHFDANKDGKVVKTEWDALAEVFAQAQNVMLAIRPGGRGDVTDTHVAWKQTRFLPYVPSPLLYDGRVYLVKDGGITSCYKAKTGESLFQGRLDVSGPFYASPIAGDGKVYMASQRGEVAVLRAGDSLDVLARNDFGEPILATPAILEGKLYIRTEGHLYAIGQ